MLLASLLDEFDSQAEFQSIPLELPKFKLQESINLKEELECIGVRKIFSETEADFGGRNLLEYLLAAHIIASTGIRSPYKCHNEESPSPH